MIVRNLLGVALNLGAALAIVAVVGHFVMTRCLGVAKPRTLSALQLWIGLTAILAYGYLLHLVGPLHGWAMGISLLVPLLLALGYGGTRLWQRRESVRSVDCAKAASAVLAVTLPFAVLSRSMLERVTNYDSYLYHLQTIEHLSAERVVVGLANLHTRLGFHSSIYTVASLFENGSWNDDGFRLANGFIVVLATWEWAGRLRGLRDGAMSMGSLPILLGVPALFSIGLPQASNLISSPSPDLSAALVSVVALGYLVDLLFVPTLVNLCGALTLTGLAMTFRPINGLLFVSALTVAGVLVLRHSLRADTRALFRSAVPSMAVVGSFIAHSVMVTGYPIYPSPVQVSPFPWAVAPALVANDLRLIESWAKRPATPPSEVLGDWSWFGDWWTRTSGQYSIFIAALLFSLALVALCSNAGLVRLTKRRAAACAIAVIPACIWFAQAPEPRFGFGQLIAASLSPLFFLELDPPPDWDGGGTPIVSWLIGGAALLAAGGVIGSSLATPDVLGNLEAARPPIQAFPLEEFMTADGKTYLMPVAGDQCGRVRWCTPYPSDRLVTTGRRGWTFVDLNLTGSDVWISISPFG